MTNTRSSVVRLAGVCAFLLVVSWGRAWAIDMKPGEYEVTTTASMPGMGEMPPQTTTTCLTMEELVPKPDQGGEQCKLTKQEVKGNSVEWAVSCNDPDEGMKGTGSGTLTYAGDSFTGTFKMDFEVPGQGSMTMEAKMTGKRVGPCSK